MNKPFLTDNRLSHSTLTDLYQLTMAQNYWKLSKKNLKTVFHLTFKDIPFGNGYIVFCGLDSVLEAVKNYAFYESDLIYLSGVKTQSKKLLFEKKFLEFLKNYKLNCNIYSVLEGTIVFAEEPVLRVEGTILDCMLLESQLLNKINFQSLYCYKDCFLCFFWQTYFRICNSNGCFSDSRSKGVASKIYDLGCNDFCIMKSRLVQK